MLEGTKSPQALVFLTESLAASPGILAAEVQGDSCSFFDVAFAFRALGLFLTREFCWHAGHGEFGAWVRLQFKRLLSMIIPITNNVTSHASHDLPHWLSRSKFPHSN